MKLVLGKLAIITIIHAGGSHLPPKPFYLEPIKMMAPMAQTTLAPIATVSTIMPVDNSGSTSGNLYPLYECTWYVKSRRPDIPNRLGNANLWFNELRAMGWAVGYTPRAGAIGQEIGHIHVVYIEYVNPDGSVHLSERNYDWHGSFRYRDAPASDFEYIY